MNDKLTVELISVGTEILMGNIINTNAAMTQPENANILLANHSGIRYWLAQQLPGQEVPGGLENASLTVLRYDRGIWRVILMNNTDYDSIPNLLEESNEE